MQWHSVSAKETARYFGVNPSAGLSRAEAQRRLGAAGPNRIEGKRGKSLLKKVAEQLSDFLVVILLVAAGISVIVSLINGEADFIDPAIILLIVVTNAIMGIVQESKAEKAIESLKKMAAPHSTVLREGQAEKADSTDIVAGDVLLLDTGDCVTADARLISASGLRLSESQITGESAPTDKRADDVCPMSAPLAERFNMVYSGSLVVAGRGLAVVTATGMDTEVGRIASLLDESEPPDTPLQLRMRVTGKKLGLVAIIACAAVFALGVLKNAPVLNSFMLAVSLAVAAVPEGLPAIVTIVLALGVSRMAGKNAIVRKLPAVETLGSATVICSDKTGTLTQNRMTVTAVAGPQGEALHGMAAQRLLTYGALCTNSVETIENGRINVAGDPTENAVVLKAIEAGLSKAALGRGWPRVAELPFDSGRKRMTTIHKSPEGGYLAVTKGAPDMLIPLCQSYDAKPKRQMDDAAKRRAMDVNGGMAGRALRVIAVAVRAFDSLPGRITADTVETKLTFIGFLAMIDPPRPEVKQAVRVCARAGIRTIMITGDHAATAQAIAGQLGIARAGGAVITGEQLDRMGMDELRRAVRHTAIFARVSPEHKLSIVKALQANGEIVAMTGDGVNDAPALKSADIGCAMGKTGTDVARDASDMVLTDDNFSTIVAAVGEGRGIYQNICKAVHFLLSCNIGEILTILVSSLMGMPSPLLPIQLLWVNMVTDSLPALALGVERPDADIMQRPPVRPGGSMFGQGRGPAIIVQGLMIGALALAAYVLGVLSGGYQTGSTYAFAVLSLSQLVHAYNIRTPGSVFSVGVLSNGKMNIAFIICTLMQVLVICLPPVAAIFGVQPLSMAQWAQVAVLSLTPLVLVEAGKALRRGLFGKSRKAADRRYSAAA